jgi:hypothetical protein
MIVPIIKKLRIIHAYNEYAEEGEKHRAMTFDGNTLVHEVYGRSETGVMADAASWILDNFTVPDSYSVVNRRSDATS